MIVRKQTYKQITTVIILTIHVDDSHALAVAVGSDPSATPARIEICWHLVFANVFTVNPVTVEGGTHAGGVSSSGIRLIKTRHALVVVIQLFLLLKVDVRFDYIYTYTQAVRLYRCVATTVVEKPHLVVSALHAYYNFDGAHWITNYH